MLRLLFILCLVVWLTDAKVVIQVLQVVNGGKLRGHLPSVDLTGKPTTTIESPLDQTLLQEQIYQAETSLNQTQESLRDIQANITALESSTAELENQLLESETERNSTAAAVENLEDLENSLNGERRKHRRHRREAAQSYELLYCPAGTTISGTAATIIQNALENLGNSEGETYQCLVGFIQQLANGIRNGTYQLNITEKEAIKAIVGEVKEEEEEALEDINEVITELDILISEANDDLLNLQSAENKLKEEAQTIKDTLDELNDSNESLITTKKTEATTRGEELPKTTGKIEITTKKAEHTTTEPLEPTSKKEEPTTTDKVETTGVDLPKTSVGVEITTEKAEQSSNESLEITSEKAEPTNTGGDDLPKTTSKPTGTETLKTTSEKSKEETVSAISELGASSDNPTTTVEDIEASTYTVNEESDMLVTVHPVLDPVTFNPTGNNTNLAIHLDVSRAETNFSASIDIDIDFTDFMNQQDVNMKIIYIDINSIVYKTDENGEMSSEYGSATYGISLNDTSMVIPFDNTETISLTIDEFQIDPLLLHTNFRLNGEIVDPKEKLRITFGMAISVNIKEEDKDANNVTAGVMDVTVKETAPA